MYFPWWSSAESASIIANFLQWFVLFLSFWLTIASLKTKDKNSDKTSLILIAIVISIASIIILISSNRASDLEQKEDLSTKNQLNSLKKYGSIAKVNSAGMEEVGGSRLSGKYSRWYEGHLTHDRIYKCDDIDIKFYKDYVEKFPEFPFPYVAIAYCLKINKKDEWIQYASEAKDILIVTTTIEGHSKCHDVALNQINAMFSR
jgi:hypothetical protein